jgi:hypothetical protein
MDPYKLDIVICRQMSKEPLLRKHYIHDRFKQYMEYL